MRLKNIEMQGFKSFADKIYLDFNPGITAIVGPNGSGKSNISDAIRWVMGEQSVKSLRGSKMEDVIFSGTEARKALGFAEVTLTLDNSDHYFHLDFPEITVTRRVYRSGEGEYYINKTLCRLKDIHELFMDTGLGRDGYSIIGQGKIDNVLSTKSEDRRQLFEEAAGISKYKYRKLEAERKLVQTTDNLTRVADILNELEGQLGPLERQSEKARHYLLLRDEMRNLDIVVSVINAEKAKKELGELNQNIALLEEQISGIKAELDQTDAEISAMYDRSLEYDQKMEECRAADKITLELMNDTKNKSSLLVNDISHSRQNISRLEEEIGNGKNEIDRIDGVLSEYDQTLAELQTKNGGLGQTQEELTRDALAMEEEAKAKNREIETAKADMIDLISQKNAATAGIENLSILADNFLERQSALEEEISGKTEDKTTLDDLCKKTKAALDACLSQIDKLQKETASLENAMQKLEAEQKELVDKQTEKQLLLNHKKSRKSMLEDMEREYEGYAKGVRGVMTAYDNGEIKGTKIYGPLAQLIHTEKKYITAIETALGSANQNIVTEQEEDAKVAIEYLKKNHLGRATFLPVSAIEPKKFQDQDAKTAKGFVAIAADLVDCEKRYEKIVSSFLGNTVVCDDLDNAIAMGRKFKHKFRIVTIAGDIIQAGGAMTGGCNGKTTGSLSRTGEIETLGKELKDLEILLKKLEEEKKALGDKQHQKQTLLQDKIALFQEAQKESVRLNAELQHQSDMLSALDSGFSQLQAEQASILQRLEDIERDKKEKADEILRCDEQYLVLEEQLKLLENQYETISVKNKQLLENLADLNLKRNTLLKDIELQNDRISRLNTEKSQNAIAMTAKSEEILRIRGEIEQMEKEMLDLAEDAQKREGELTHFRDTLENLAKEKTELDIALREKQASIKDVQEQVFQLTQQQGKMESRAEKFEMEIEGIVERLLEEYEMPYSDATEIKPGDDFDYQEASTKIRSLREQIRALGNINIDAIEEYKNVKERFDFLTTQTNDLEKARKELESVISEMMQIMQTRFAEQFQIINQNFSRVFVSLFGGGRANLTLTDPSYVLESGIEIEAQPPGKKLQNLSLLSGGEKAFTAIALLFAILDVRPTPFCILDEIEAALDDVNVYRFADYLKHYSDKTQFIVVTHRRGTMESANILYGVTMQERGISKLLSLDIDEIQQ